MNNFILKSIALSLLVFFSVTAIAQDKIYKKNQDVILCKIVEIGEAYVKYTQEDTEALIFSIDVMRVDKIVFESGKELVFQDKITDPELYYGQSKNAFKMGLFSPITGALSLGYERSLKPGASIEASIGFIGLGFNDLDNNNSTGTHFDAGYKFIITPSHRTPGASYSHLLRGFYFKPKIAMALYGRDFEYYNHQTGSYDYERNQVIAGAFMIDMGWQWIVGDVFLLNMYGGFGYGFDNMSSILNSNNDYYGGPGYHYGFTVGQQIPIAFTGGLKIGFTK